MKIPPELAFTGPIMLGPSTDTHWRQSYRTCPYMRDMADDDLRQRLKDIFRNFMTVNSAGKASPIPVSSRWHS